MLKGKVRGTGQKKLEGRLSDGAKRYSTDHQKSLKRKEDERIKQNEGRKKVNGINIS
jgi:hypothetical protein